MFITYTVGCIADTSNFPSFSVESEDGNTVGVFFNPERLLSHIIFTPILKSASSIIRIEYTITVSVSPTQDSDTTVSLS